MEYLFLLVGFVVMVLVTLTAVARRYRRCPSDRVLVVYGKIAGSDSGLSAKCYHGGASFVWPIIQDYQFLDLTPMPIDIKLEGALSQQNIRVNTPSTFTVGISTEPGVMENAAERVLGLTQNEIQELARDIIFGQMRVVIATMPIEEINADRDKLIENISNGVEVELKKVGLRLINVNVQDITDESGYIDALGKEAAARAINEAKRKVAEQTKAGEIGRAEAERDQRVSVASAGATAVEGENTAKVTIAQSDASRREAEAEAERIRRVKRGEADGIRLVMEAEADGAMAILSRKAEGLRAIVEAAGGSPELASLLMVTEQMPSLVESQVQAISNLKIDKVTVWDSGNGADGKNATASFLSGMVGAIPPLHEITKNVSVRLPEFLGEVAEDASGNGAAPPVPEDPEAPPSVA